MDPSGTSVPEAGNGIRVFVGGIPVDTSQQDLIDSFSFYGRLAAARVLRDGQTGRGRGFGFVIFANEADAKRCCEQESRPLRDRMVTVRIADPEFGGQPQVKNYNAAAPASNGARVFIGGMPNCSDTEIAEHFRQFGTVLATKVVTDRDTGKPRGFGFCLFSSEAEADRACAQKYQVFLGKKVEVRPADPKPGAAAGEAYGAAAGSPAAVQQYYNWLSQYQQCYMQYYLQAQELAARQAAGGDEATTEGVTSAASPAPEADYPLDDYPPSITALAQSRDPYGAMGGVGYLDAFGPGPTLSGPFGAPLRVDTYPTPTADHTGPFPPTASPYPPRFQPY
jgi:hypothetical protein